MFRSAGRAAALITAGCVSLAAVATAATISSSAAVDTTAVRLDPPSPALLISDSAWLGIKTYGAIDALQGFDHMLDLASCRRRVSPSCVNYDGHVPITLARELGWRHAGYSTLIVATGYNDSDHNFRSDVETIVGLARANGYERVVWLTLRSNVSYESPGNAGFAQVFARNNATLRELVASGRYPEIVIADWGTYARDRPEWFARDGIHLRIAGPWAAADYVSRKMAAIEGRPCPQPVRVDAAVEVPCPDPDAAPPVADIEGLYPVGEPNPTAGFHMEWEGHGSWPSPPWWER